MEQARRNAEAPTLRPVPIDGVVTGSPDGAYYDLDGKKAQIIVVGPMRFNPVEYQVALRDQVTTELYDIASLEFMEPPNDPRGREIAMQRGFVSMIFVQPESPT